jgi:hypothetical protein
MAGTYQHSVYTMCVEPVQPHQWNIGMVHHHHILSLPKTHTLLRAFKDSLGLKAPVGYLIQYDVGLSTLERWASQLKDVSRST